MHGGVNDAIAGHPETPCPFSRANDDPNDVRLKQNGLAPDTGEKPGDGPWPARARRE